MPGVLGLVAVIVGNYLRHRRGSGPTICQVTRRHLPPRWFALAFTAGYLYLLAHVLRGYPRDTRRP